MSLVGTLGRMAVGIAVAKGVGKMMNRGGAGGSGGGLGGLLGGALGGGSSAGGAAGGLGGLLGSALGGKSGAGGGGLGGLLGSVLGGAGQRTSGGGMGDLGALLGGGNSSGGMAGGLGGLLESISGGSMSGNAGATPPAGGSLGDLLNSALQGKQIPEPAPEQEDQARILIRAMVNAAKCDGEIDQDEQQKIVSNLGDEVTDEERQFVISEMQSPLDAEGFIRSIPKGAEMQVYMMSLLGIDLDSREEAQYLDTLRRGVGMSEEQCNAIHEKLGVPTLYS